MHSIIKKIIVLLSLLAVLLVGYNVNKIWENKKSKDKLIISTFSAENKGDILSLNLNDNTKNTLIKDRQVGITGDLSADGSKIAYVDALGDNDPWQIYLYNFTDNQTCTVTNDNFGKSHAKISNDNSIYFITSTKQNIVKLGKINPETNSYDIIDKDDSDRQLDAFDIKNNKLIISTDSRSLELKEWKENKGHYMPITHTLFEIDPDGNNLKKIAEIQASSVQSISYNYDCKKIIIGGFCINGDSSYGIYELSVDTGVLTTILTDDILANTENSIVTEIAHPPLATMSKDENLIYFTGVHKNSEKVNIAGLSGYPTAIFSYNMNTKELKEVFKPEVSSIIFDMNIKY